MIFLKIALLLVLFIWGFLLRRGKLLFLIAGNNDAKKPYGKKSIVAGRYVGLIFYGADIVLLLTFVPDIPNNYFWGILVVMLAFMLTVTILLNIRMRKMSQ
ncbi:DUF3784 domain-containing protein [Agrilactobacillus composti]|uniref:DUF3784 domain-containing protein n=1 Tax=Agrilactobacillus composti TaxID=398555 RepID=UPI000704B13A|nr:DUF3784 domain-containing protein [Agrilactobacillus composti]